MSYECFWVCPVGFEKLRKFRSRMQEDIQDRSTVMGREMSSLDLP